ncbi:hypothetical protein TcWFU_007885 [Taenia crassiceps]|uniref:Uncharacterized protein n=1 Tax=Taenia crassiceps TaxID=6207 RepID=A0ABR4Q8D7_9CEST
MLEDLFSLPKSISIFVLPLTTWTLRVFPEVEASKSNKASRLKHSTFPQTFTPHHLHVLGVGSDLSPRELNDQSRPLSPA